jgi:hypothetical protein
MLDGFAVGKVEGFADGRAVLGFEDGIKVGPAVGKAFAFKQRPGGKVCTKLISLPFIISWSYLPVAVVGCLHCGN